MCFFPCVCFRFAYNRNHLSKFAASFTQIPFGCLFNQNELRTKVFLIKSSRNSLNSASLSIRLQEKLLSLFVWILINSESDWSDHSNEKKKKLSGAFERLID